MAGIWMIIIAALLLIFGITIEETILGILLLIGGAIHLSFKLGLLDTFIRLN